MTHPDRAARVPKPRSAAPKLFGRAALTAAALAALAGCGGDGDGPADYLHDAPVVLPAVRPDTPGNNRLFKFEPTDVVETFPSTDDAFLVHFTRNGPNAVPAKDDDTSGVPDFVEEVASVYVEVLARYKNDLGFRAPRSDADIADNGGDDRFDVYLVDFAGKGDGAYRNDACDAAKAEICAGYMVQENDFVGYGYPSTLVANRILGSHEFFHATQAAYDIGQDTIVTEGTAVWATETFDPSLQDFEGFIPGYLQNCDRSLEVPLPGPVDPFSYGSAIWFQFLEEKYGEGMIRSLWERLENGAGGVANPEWYETLGPLLEKEAQTTFPDAFVEFARWNLYTGKHADPATSYGAGAGYSPVKMEAVTAPYSEDQLRMFHSSAQYFAVPPDGRASMTAALVPPPDDPGAADGLAMLLAVDSGSAFDPVVALDAPTDGVVEVDTSAATRLVVAVVNGAPTGDSKKPALCIGTVDEVAACRTAIVGVGVGGAGGAGGSGSGTGASGVNPSPPAEDGGCGCRTRSTSPDLPWGAACAALLAGLAAQRRRRRVRATATARAMPRKLPA